MPGRDAWIGVGLTAVSGLAFGLAFPPASWLPLAWFSLVPFLLALRRGGVARALLLTWLWCLAAAYSVGDWFAGSVAEYFHQPMPIALGLFFAVFTVMAGPYYMAFALAWRVLGRRFVVALPFLGAAAWVMAELGRGALFTGTALFIGNPWGLLGYTHADSLLLAQIASLSGIYGVSFVLFCVNAAVAELIHSWPRAERRGRAIAGFLLAPLPAAGCIAFGWAELDASRDGPFAEPVEIAVAQGNVAIGARWRADAYGENLGVYLRLTSAAVERADPVLVFWPEAALTFFLEDEDLYRQGIGAFLRRNDLELVTGGPRAVDGDRDRYANSVFVVQPGGDITARYDKEYLVPFAEYFPLEVDVLRRSFGRIRFFEHGEQTAPVATRAGPAGVLVCNESMLPEAARRRVNAGAVYLVNPSNDTWISDEKYTEQQLDIAVMRAIEQRRWLVRASTSGPSAIVDPWGRVRGRTPGLERAVAVGEIRPRSDRTVYARLGDAFAYACVVATLLGVAWVLRSERPAPRSQ